MKITEERNERRTAELLQLRLPSGIWIPRESAGALLRLFVSCLLLLRVINASNSRGVGARYAGDVNFDVAVEFL